VKYECFINPGFHCQDIEADNAESARQQFAELIRDNLEAEHIIANNLDTEDGEDPSPNVPVRRGTPSPQVAGSAIPDWKRRLPVNNNGNSPLTWEGPNGPCEEKHGDQCQCVKCARPQRRK
jgi:hypothetical protein